MYLAWKRHHHQQHYVATIVQTIDSVVNAVAKEGGESAVAVVKRNYLMFACVIHRRWNIHPLHFYVWPIFYSSYYLNNERMNKTQIQQQQQRGEGDDADFIFAAHQV